MPARYTVVVDAPLPLSIAIITLNEEANLPRCLASVRDLAAEIVVIDSGSTDRTAELARQCGAVFEFHKWQGHVAQKNVALRRCSQPWVLCLDADEAVSPELAAAIYSRFAVGQPREDGCWVNRRTFYLGDWIRHVWYPEWRLRLVRKERAQWRGVDPHDRLEVAGETKRLDGDLLHYSYRDLQDHLQRTIRYAQISANSYDRAGKSSHWYYLLFSPWIAFFRQLVIRQGWRDGWRGWLIAGVTMIHVFAKYAFLLEKRRSQSA
ncbi:MAG TPA: glycosyltransferase family 2 protein [Verrucomicrobiae bacterium]|nr:glycosyltransferase family 2 protein [Verrucomicrobiae bacterium]